MLALPCLLATLALAPPLPPAADSMPAPEALAYLPPSTTLLIAIDRPGEVVGRVANFRGVELAATLQGVRDSYSTPEIRKAMAILQQVEADLGADHPELLERLAGRGLTVAAEVGVEKGPALITLAGTDAAFTRRALAYFRRALADGMANDREPGAPVPEWASKTVPGGNIESLGGELHVAVDGVVVRISNRFDTLKASLGAKSTRSAKSFDPSRALALRRKHPTPPAAWAWVDLVGVKATPQGKDFFANTRKEIVGTMLFGGTVDAIRRSDDVFVALDAGPEAVALSVHYPAGRAGLPPELAVHAPPPGKPGSLPLLTGEGVVYAQSYYLDLNSFWTRRKELFNPVVLPDFEKFERDISKIIPGTTLGEMLTQSGPYHRLALVAPAPEPLYASAPRPMLPGLVYVLDLADAKLGPSLASAARAGAAIAGLTAGLRMKEETVDGVAITSYRFPEDRAMEADPGNLRFHAVPCFAQVGKSFAFASRPDALKAVLPALRAESKGAATDPALWRGRALGEGLAGWLRTHPAAATAEIVLTQGGDLASAKKQVEKLAQVLEQLRGPELVIDWRETGYTLRIELAAPDAADAKSGGK